MSGSYSNHKIELVLNSIEENQRLIDICSKKLEKDPTSKKALLLRANLYIKIEQFLKAEKDLTTLFTDPILCSTAYYLMGIIAKKQNKFENSKQYLTLSIENDPNNVNALFLRGAILNLQGKFQEAINDYYLALEGSLKLKEISYIHSETYAAGELKHGTISLIEEGTPVISILTDITIYEKTISNIKETKARGAYSLVIARDNLNINQDIYDDVIKIPNLSDLVTCVLTVVPLQLLAYYVALELKYDIDKPRNLAKSVTVE